MPPPDGITVPIFSGISSSSVTLYLPVEVGASIFNHLRVRCTDSVEIFAGLLSCSVFEVGLLELRRELAGGVPALDRARRLLGSLAFVGAFDSFGIAAIVQSCGFV